MEFRTATRRRNEGKIIIGVVPQKVEEASTTLKQTREGRKRILTPPIGDPVPRIC